MDRVLTEIEIRVLGCLMEKEVTTPDYYPLTLNALVNACNQKSNRHPVLMLGEKDVVKALETMRYDHHLVCRMSETGSRVPKYSHTLLDTWTFSTREMAVLCVLFLRGPQTVGEIRTHTNRLFKFTDTDMVLTTLNYLANREPDALVMQLPREPGRREQRWAHLFSGEIDLDAPAFQVADEPVRIQMQEENERMEVLEAEVKLLRETIEQMKKEFAEFKQQFD